MTFAAPQILLPALLLSGGGFAGLRQSGYGNRSAAVLMMLLGGQAGILAAIALPGHSLWLAAGVAWLAASGSSFAEREDVRHLILFGGALAAIQLCDPMGALLAAAMLPIALAIGSRRYGRRGAVGFYALLLFPPVLMAVTLFYVAALHGVHPISSPVAWLATHAPAGLPGRLALALTPIAVAVPALALVQGYTRGRAVLFVAAATGLAGMAAVWRGAIREPVTLLAVAAPLTAGAVAALPAGPRRSWQAITASASSLGLSWAVLVLVWR